MPTTFDQQQQFAFDSMMAGRNVFLSGYAGTGKSLVLNAFRENCLRSAVFLAPSGLAALNIKGITIHRFLGLPPIDLYPLNSNFDLPRDRATLISFAETIVIDEISMVRSDLFQMLESVLRQLHLPLMKDHPFGGRQIVVCGDFCQLPPVVRTEEQSDYLAGNFGGQYSFTTPAWHAAQFHNIFLTDIHRQIEHSMFSQALNAVRVGDMALALEHPGKGLAALPTGDSIDYINRHSMITPTPPDDRLVLCMTNREANSRNFEAEAAIPGAPYEFRAIVRGDIDMDAMPADEALWIKMGSRVMCVANNMLYDNVYGYVNGDLGTVVGLGPRIISVLLDRNRSIVHVQRKEWEAYDYELNEDPCTGEVKILPRLIGHFIQIPLRLAHAITIHKSQGLTLPSLHLHLAGRTFVGGQLYVAVSRVKDIGSLSLSRPIEPADIMIDSAAVRFDRTIREGDFMANAF